MLIASGGKGRQSGSQGAAADADRTQQGRRRWSGGPRVSGSGDLCGKNGRGRTGEEEKENWRGERAVQLNGGVNMSFANQCAKV